MAKNMVEARLHGYTATYRTFFARNDWGFGARSVVVVATITTFLSHFSDTREIIVH